MCNKASTRWVGYAALSASMALVGAYVALAKPLVALLPVLLVAWLRFGIAAVAMLPWLRKPADEPALTARVKWLVFWDSLLGNFLFSLLMLFGVSLTTASSAGVILAFIPAMVALLSRVFLREALTRQTLLAIGLAAAGIAWYAAQGNVHTEAAYPQAWLGNLLVFGAVCCEAAYAVIGKQLAGHLRPRRVAALINLWGLALCTPVALWLLPGYSLGVMGLPEWGLLVFYALAASVGTVWLWIAGLRHVPANQAGVFTVWLPVSAAAVGVGVLGETITAAQAAALGLALLGVALTAWQRGAPHGATASPPPPP
jgi:drug/metabolite transporter (DMT)-like permease